MSQLTILESRDFWDELIKRSEIAEHVAQMYGKSMLKALIRSAFELKAEYDEKMKEASE
jgi:hypothetical protein